MTAFAFAIGGLLAVVSVVYVALPFLREPEPGNDVLDEPGALERRALELAERRDRALSALKELEFDHRTGKVSDEDYRELVGPLRQRVAETLQALEPRAESNPTTPPPARAASPAEISENRKNPPGVAHG